MIGFFEYQYLRFKKNHLKNLVALARADGHFHRKEKDYLYSIGEKYQLKHQQIEGIIEGEADSDLQIPKEHHKRIAFLYDTIGMMLADGVIDDKEMVFCVDMFNRFGYKRSLIDLMITAHQTGELEDPLAWETFVEQVRKEQG